MHLEIARIILRYLSVVLLLVGVPAELVEPLGDPGTLNLAAGLIAAALAEGGWIMSKLRKV